MKWTKFSDEMPPKSGAYYWVREDGHEGLGMEEPALYFEKGPDGPRLEIIGCEEWFYPDDDFHEWLGPIPWEDELIKMHNISVLHSIRNGEVSNVPKQETGESPS